MTDQLRSPAPAAGESQMSRRLPLGVLAALLVLIAAGIAWKLWPRHLPAASDTIAVAKLTNSSDFA